MAFKLAAPLLLLAVTVLASKEPAKPADSVAIASQPAKSQQAATTAKKTPHGKREIASYGLPHHHHQQQLHRYSFGQPLSELYAAPATSHGAYSYSIPAHSSFPSLHTYGSYGPTSHKLFLGSGAPSYKYSLAPSSVASSHAFFTPLVHHHQQQPATFAHSFHEPTPSKYSAQGFGTKDLSELLKQLHSVGPLTIKPISNSFAYGGGSFGQHEHDSGAGFYEPASNALHLSPKPMTIKLTEFPSFGHPSLPQPAALTAPAAAGPTSTSSTYGHVSHSLSYLEPSYASGVKGLRHYSTPNGAPNDLFSAGGIGGGGKYLPPPPAGAGSHQPVGASMVSPLHTSVHSTIGHQKPFKPSTYLGSTHDTISSAPSTSHTHTHPLPSGASYLAPSLQYLPAVNKAPQHHPHKLSYDSPAKHGAYLPPAPPSTNAYLPPTVPASKTTAAHGYLPPVNGAHSNYIPLSSTLTSSSSSSAGPSSAGGSHEDVGRKPSLHPHHHEGQSGESLEFSHGSTLASAAPTAVTPHHWKH